mmetsp:Transcript_4446/g.6642  ORF Transcript_4446/g.6642 Transcript_4446/m.6642 type:complete len:204 (-) Transcript_4446:413-1024(-)
MATSTTTRRVTKTLISKLQTKSILNSNNNGIKTCQMLRRSTVKNNNTFVRSIASTSIHPNEAAEAAKPFNSPQAEELFQKIIMLPKEEINLIGDLMAEKCGITMTPFDLGLVAAPAGAGGGAAEEEEAKEEEKKTFDLRLTAFDAKSKIKVIKEVRALFSLGLKEAKELVDNAPKVLKKDMKQEEAEKLKETLEAVGATVEIV